MSSRCLKSVAGGLFAAFCATACAAQELRVCADPDNLPYSHRDESGFENRIARLLAEELQRPLAYFWLPQRRGFVRKTLGAGECDVLIGVPAGFERVTTTRPYYRSQYAAVYRRGTQAFPGFAAGALRGWRIGVQLVGNDLAATPPGYALARAGLIDNVRGYPVYGEGPAAQRMVDAVASGELDLALVWGAQAGYFVRKAAAPLALAPAPRPEGLSLPFEFSIAMGVRKGDTALRDALDAAIERRRSDIAAILEQYGVPLLPLGGADQR